MTRRALVAVAISLVGAGCAIDTELGLDVVIHSSMVDVRAEAEGDVVGVTFDSTYRVGEHAPEAHRLMPQAIDVLAGGVLVATMMPNRPPGFVANVMPGQSFSATFTGESRLGAASDARSLCGAEATILFRWSDDTFLGMAEATTTAITCD